MDITNVDFYLNQYQETELFYRSYYDAKNDANKYQTFLNNVDINYLNQNKLVIEEFKDQLNFTFAEEYTFWNKMNKDIMLEKHLRYMPQIVLWHNFYELIYVYKGSFTYCIDDNNYIVHEGDICLMSPHLRHTLKIYDDSIAINIKIKKSTFNQSFYNLLTSSNIISQFFINTLYTGNYSNYVFFHTGSDKKIRNLILEMFVENYNEEKYCENILNNTLMILFSYLLRKFEDTAEIPFNNQKESIKIASILNNIQTNYKNISLKNLAKDFYLSEPYLSKFIKENAGINFGDIVKNIRLEKACGFLTKSNMNISEISESIGYSNVEHFIRMFKNKYNMSPLKYRKLNNRNYK